MTVVSKATSIKNWWGKEL